MLKFEKASVILPRLLPGCVTLGNSTSSGFDVLVCRRDDSLDELSSSYLPHKQGTAGLWTQKGDSG